MEDEDIISPLEEESAPSQSSRDNSEDGFLDVVGATTRQMSTGVALYKITKNVARDFYQPPSIQDIYGDQAEVDPLFDLESAFNDYGIEENDRGYYYGCDSFKEFDETHQAIQQEHADRELMSRHPWQSLLAGIGVGIAEMALTPASAATSIMKLAGVGKATSVASAAVKGAKVGVLMGAGNTVARYASQKTMSEEDVVIESVAAALVGGAFSSIAYSFDIKKMLKATRDIGERFKSLFSDIKYKISDSGSITELSSTSDKVVNEYRLNEMHPFVQKVVAHTPVMQGLTSKSKVVRKFANALYRHSFETKETASGIASAVPAELGLNVSLGKFVDAHEGYVREFAKYREKVDPRMTGTQFGMQVMKYLREGVSQVSKEVSDAGDICRKFYDDLIDLTRKYGLTELIPEIHEGVKDQVLKRGEENLTIESARKAFGKDFRELRLFPEPEKVSEHRVSRVYSRAAIFKYPERFKNLVRLGILKNGPFIEEELLDKIVDDIFNGMVGLNPAEKYISEISFNDPRLMKINNRLKILVSDDLLDDFLVQDPIVIAYELHRNLSPTIELTRALNGYGFKDIDAVRTAFAEERDAALKGLKGNKLRQAVIDWNKEADKIDIGELLLNKKYDAPETNFDLALAKAAHNLKTFNYITQLGGSVMTFITDYASAINSFGVGKTIRVLSKSFGDEAAAKINKKDLLKVGAAIDDAIHGAMSRVDEFMDLGVYRTGRITQGLKQLSNKFSRVTFMSQFNDFNKRWVTTLHGTDILETCKKGRFSVEDLRFLANSHISRKDAVIIGERAKTVVEFDKNGLAIFNLDLWEDDSAKFAFSAALAKTGNQIIISNSLGNTPLFLRSKWGNLLTQYRSYIFSLSNNVLLPMLNGQKDHAPAAILGFLGIGALVTYMKSLSTGDPYTHVDDPNWMKETLEMSGILGFFGDYAFTASRALRNARSAGEFVEYTSPQLGSVSNFARAAKTAWKTVSDSSYTPSEREIRTIKSLIPFNNLLYFNGFLNNAIRHNAQNRRAKLMKTKDDRYFEVD